MDDWEYPYFRKPPYGVLLSIRLRRIRIDDNPWLDPWKSYETTRTKGDMLGFEHCSIHGLIHLNHEGFGVSHQGLRPEKKPHDVQWKRLFFFGSSQHNNAEWKVTKGTDVDIWS